jgi:hypothetical protein
MPPYGTIPSNEEPEIESFGGYSISYQLSVISYQLSVISYQWVSHQLSVISG